MNNPIPGYRLAHLKPLAVLLTRELIVEIAWGWRCGLAMGAAAEIDGDGLQTKKKRGALLGRRRRWLRRGRPPSLPEEPEPDEIY